MYHSNTITDYLCLGGFIIGAIVLMVTFIQAGSNNPKGINVTPDDEGPSYGYLLLGLFGIPAILCGVLFALVAG